jgi:hypothetical protein
MASDLRSFVKSKEDLYVILSIEGQLHLPPYDECTMDFMRAALSGKKKLITNRDLAMVNVPRYKEFNAANLYKAALADEELRNFVPDMTNDKSSKVVNRKFLFNVSDDQSPESFFRLSTQSNPHSSNLKSKRRCGIGSRNKLSPRTASSR